MTYQLMKLWLLPVVGVCMVAAAYNGAPPAFYWVGGLLIFFWLAIAGVLMPPR